MGQELLLKTDVIAKPTAIGKNQTIDNASEQGNEDIQPFSSALDEQLEKQPVEQKKSNKEPVSEQPEKGETLKTSDSPAEKLTSEDGNVLPEVAELADEDIINFLVSDEGEEVSEKAELDDSALKAVGKSAEDDSKTVALLDDTLIKLPTQNEKPQVKVDVKEEVKPRFIVGENKTGLKAQQALETVKSSVVETSDTELKKPSSDIKQQAPVLRSDILNALNKKPAGDGGVEKVFGKVIKTDDAVIKTDNAVIKTEKVMTAQLLDKPLNDVRKMAELLNQQKTESPILKVGAERNVTGLYSTLTAGVPTSAATTAIQGASVAQPVLAMQPSMQSQAWGKVLSSRVVWMAREGVQQAELRLNPANLGPVEVKLHMNNDQANVTFVAQNAATRDALEQALPRLRESFQENGMDLANADVSDQQTEQNDEEENSNNSSTGAGMASNELEGDDVNQNDSMESNELEVGVSVFA